MVLSTYAMSAEDIDYIMEQAAAVGGPRAMANGVTYKQGIALDNAGYHGFETFNPATNQDTPGDRVQAWFDEVDAWKKSPTYQFRDSDPVPGEFRGVRLPARRPYR